MSYQPKSFDQLIYPMDASPDNFYPEAVCFTVLKKQGIRLDDITGKVQASWEKGQASSVSDNATEAEVKSGVISKQVSEGESTGMLDKIKDGLSFSGDTVKQFASNSTRSWAQKTADEEGRTSPLGTIYLNMPNAIGISEEASWGGTELGAMGSAFKGALGSTGENAGNAAKSAVMGQAGNMLSAGVGAMAGKMASMLGLPVGGFLGAALGTIGGSSLQAGIESATGLKQNPYLEMMFSGIGFRNFKFDFILRPRDSGETQVVAQILKMFREHSRPSFLADHGRAFMNYPMLFDIKFLTLEHGTAKPSKPEGQQTSGDSQAWTINRHLPKIKKCVCTNVETNYTPNGVWTAFNMGAPVSVTLGLSFQETELVTAEDINKEWPHMGAPQGNALPNTEQNNSAPNDTPDTNMNPHWGIQ